MNGYRISILRKGSVIVKYITETEAGTMRQAEKMAIKLRDIILKALRAAPMDSKQIIEKYAAMSKDEILTIAKCDE